MRRPVHRLRSELADAQRRAQRAEVLAGWQQELAGEADCRAAEQPSSRAASGGAEVLALRAEQSATAARLISRYRPWGRVRRRAGRCAVISRYRALGRRSIPAPAVAPLGPVALRTCTPWLTVVLTLILIGLDRRLDASIGNPGHGGSFLQVPFGSLASFLVAFSIGMVLQAYRDKIPLSPFVAWSLRAKLRRDAKTASTSDPSVGHRRRLEELRECPELTERQPAVPAASV